MKRNLKRNGNAQLQIKLCGSKSLNDYIHQSLSQYLQIVVSTIDLKSGTHENKDFANAKLKLVKAELQSFFSRRGQN